MKQIVLASSSPRRKKLLESIGLDVRVIASNIDEKLNPRLKGVGQAESLSEQKAAAVLPDAEGYVVVGADTLVLLGDEMLGKPKTDKEAKRMLSKLSGRKHSVVTGYTIISDSGRRRITSSVVTDVYFKVISKSDIDSYIKKEKVMDKAGAYAIQGLGALFVERIEGDFFNVVGLPIFSVAKSLRKFGVEIL